METLPMNMISYETETADKGVQFTMNNISL